jgi:hypothetical protein
MCVIHFLSVVSIRRPFQRLRKLSHNYFQKTTQYFYETQEQQWRRAIAVLQLASGYGIKIITLNQCFVTAMTVADRAKKNVMYYQKVNLAHLMVFCLETVLGYLIRILHAAGNKKFTCSA